MTQPEPETRPMLTTALMILASVIGAGCMTTSIMATRIKAGCYGQEMRDYWFPGSK
jgi:hydroxyethylthiazole kinase-like sugar kinase family protein